MKEAELLPAISAEAIFAKSKAYASRALRCKSADEMDEYQLWASLALELLGKACLARIHPCLIVNPTDQISLFAAAGLNLGTDIKTIATHTLYDRLRHITKGFDEKVKKFCDDLSQRRNAELHSGELPVREMKLPAWEGRYWHAAQIVLERMDSTLEEWLGASQARAPKEIVLHARQAVTDAARIRIERAREQFDRRSKKSREAALEDAASKSTPHYRSVLYLMADARWRVKCPSCGGKAIMGGIQFHEEILESYPYDEEYGGPEEELVEKLFSAEEFFCPVCELRLNGQDEIEAAELETEHSHEETRERRYEEEYNNE